MYEDNERTDHKDIMPAKYRLTEYKRKSFGKLFTQQSQDRPMSGATSNFGNADVTTQA